MKQVNLQGIFEKAEWDVISKVLKGVSMKDADESTPQTMAERFQDYPEIRDKVLRLTEFHTWQIYMNVAQYWDEITFFKEHM